MSTISQYEAHAGAGDVGEGYKEPQGGPRYEEGKDNSHQALDSTDERSIANKVSSALFTHSHSLEWSEEELELEMTLTFEFFICCDLFLARCCCQG